MNAGKDFAKGPFSGGISINTQRAVVGLSVGFWPRVWAPNARVYVGPVRAWGAVRLKPKRKK